MFDEIRAFYGEVPAPFLTLAHDPGYLGDFWGALRHSFDDHALTRRLKGIMAVQSVASLITIVVVGARAVNILA